MIFGSFGLLVVALALLIAAVVKSSVAIGIASLMCTAMAVLCLVAANAYYRKAKGADGQRPADDEAQRAQRPDAFAPAPATMAMFPQMAMANGAGYANGQGEPQRDAGAWGQAPIENYAQLSAAQAVAAVDMLNLEQLHTLRRYEAENSGRKTVLAAIDDRVSGIVKLRRSLEA